MGEPEDSMIDGDIECDGCRYNLRGLSKLGNCPECGSPLAQSIAVHKKTYSSRFRRIRPNRLRMLLIAHVAVGLVYLVLIIVPHVIQNEPWAVAYQDTVAILSNSATHFCRIADGGRPRNHDANSCEHKS